MTIDNGPTGRQIDSILGRYEYIGGGSSKFYEVMYVGDSLDGQPQFDIRWGRIGAKKPQGMRVDYWYAEDKLREKRKKGYQLVPGSFKSVADQRKAGLQAIVEQVRPAESVVEVLEQEVAATPPPASPAPRRM